MRGMLTRTPRKVYRVHRQSNLGGGIELKFPIIGILSADGQLFPGLGIAYRTHKAALVATAATRHSRVLDVYPRD